MFDFYNTLSGSATNVCPYFSWTSLTVIAGVVSFLFYICFLWSKEKNNHIIQQQIYRPPPMPPIEPNRIITDDFNNVKYHIRRQAFLNGEY